MRLAGKAAVITGAGVGIGRATALLFAKEGASVAVADLNPTTGQETVALIEAAGGKAFFVQADVSQAEPVQEMLRQTQANFGRIDVLFNNAGIVKQGRVEDSSVEDWNAQIATTLTSVFLGCKYAIPIMRAQGGGVLINMASVAGMMGIVNRAVYSAAKGGVIGLTRAIALDHAGEGIRCVYLSPATIETPSLTDRINSSPDPAEARKSFEARQPVGRLGRPDDVAYAALYLASDESTFLTGSGITVDGGMAV
ncbi:MAG: short-chain dehydrogenase/reductase [Chthonomonadaceae bacterium]|nr:short-chain dehydrogenase/reductase [Chthonomonadaceae bacterium]